MKKESMGIRESFGDNEGKNFTYHSPTDSIQLTLPQTANNPRLQSPHGRKNSSFDFQLRELHSSGQHEMSALKKEDRRELQLQLNGMPTFNTDYTDIDSQTGRTSYLKLRPGETVE